MRFQSLLYPLLAVSILTVIAYIPAIRGPFVFDDVNVIENDPAIRAFPPELQWSNPASRPLVGLTFSLNYQIGGFDSSGFHILNIFFHLVCGWLVAELVRMFCLHYRGDDDGRTGFMPALNEIGVIGCAVLFAALWLLHPLSSSAAAYIVQRSEILAACAIVGFLIAIMRDASVSHRRWQWVASLVFISGMFCKVNTVSALPIAMLLDRLLLSQSWRHVFKQRGVLYLVPLSVGLASFLMMLPALRRGDGGAGFAAEEIPTVPVYLATQSRVLWHYLSLCIWPSDLCIDYRWPPISSVREAFPWILLTLGLLGTGVFLYCRGRLIGWLMLSVFLLLAPTSTLIPVTDIALDHRMYLASAAVIACVLIAAQSIVDRLRWAPSVWVVKAIAGAVLVAMFVRTSMRANDWGSGFDLWKSASLTVPHNPRALQNLTNAADQEGRRAELLSFLVALRADLDAKGRPAPAVASRLAEELLKSEQAVDVEPLLTEAIEGLSATGPIDERQELAAAHVNLGLLRLQQGQVASAEQHFKLAIASDFRQAFAYAILGDLAFQRADYGDAIAYFQKALKIRPGWEQVEGDLARAKAAVAVVP